MISNKIIDFSFINSTQAENHLFKETSYYKLAKDIAKINNIKLYEGAYTYTIGPSYETSSEIEEIINLGGNAVGMSTFPEYLNCKKLKINPVIISCLTNYGAGLKEKKVLHAHVLKNAKKTNEKFNLLIKNIIKNIEI